MFVLYFHEVHFLILHVNSSKSWCSHDKAHVLWVLVRIALERWLILISLSNMFMGGNRDVFPINQCKPPFYLFWVVFESNILKCLASVMCHMNAQTQPMAKLLFDDDKWHFIRWHINAYMSSIILSHDKQIWEVIDDN